MKDKEFWLMFFEDPLTKGIHVAGYAHNATADYKNNPYFIGMKKIKVDLQKLRGTK